MACSQHLDIQYHAGFSLAETLGSSISIAGSISLSVCLSVCLSIYLSFFLCTSVFSLYLFTFFSFGLSFNVDLSPAVAA